MERLFDKLEKRGELYWPRTDYNTWTFMHDGHGQSSIDTLFSYVPQKNVVIQAGGNVGFYISKYAETFKTVYTFEPDPLNFLALSLNSDYSNVIKFNACVGDQHNLVSLNHVESDVGATHVEGLGRIPTLKIDDLNVNECDLIQLDTEGYEYFALLGAEKTIDKFKPVLCIEICHYARYGVTQEMITTFLSRWDYELVATARHDFIFVPK